MWSPLKAPLYYQSNADFVNGKLFDTENSMKRPYGMADLTIKKSKMSLISKDIA
jgi:hypothetical protein